MNRKAIILVAGKGTRLAPRTEKIHKCLTEVNGKAIIDNALRNLGDIGVKEVLLVVGYLGNQIKETLGTERYGISISYAENKDYEITNTSASLKIGIDAVNDYDELLILEGDVFFDISVLRALVEEKNNDCTVLEPYNDTLEGTFAEINNKDYVIDWRHKSTQDENYSIRDKYKTVNLHRFSKETINRIIVPTLNKNVSDNAGKNPLEYVMQEVVRENPNLIKGVVLKDMPWVEIDDEKDLEIAERAFLQ